MARKKLDERVDLIAARNLLQTEWIKTNVNHLQVGYRFCLPVQLLGKLTNAALDALSLQHGSSADTDSRSWDARSLAAKAIAPFNLSQESVLGSSNDPYVGNAMRIPRIGKRRCRSSIPCRRALALSARLHLPATQRPVRPPIWSASMPKRGRHRFLSHAGLHLDTWNTQPGHRTAWKKLLESV